MQALVEERRARQMLDDQVKVIVSWLYQWINFTIVKIKIMMFSINFIQFMIWK